MLQQITLLGTYTGADKRGIVVGGTPLIPGMPPKKIRVDEETFTTLLKGVENGWFKIAEDNYSKFITSRFRSTQEVPTKEAPVEEVRVQEVPVEEVQAQEVQVEETPAEEVKPTAKKKPSRKKTAKTEE